MPPWIIAAIPFVLTALAGLIAGSLLVGPFVLPGFLRKLPRDDLDRVRAAAKGAFFVVADLVKRTPFAADDDLPKVIQMIVDHVEHEIGRRLKDDEKRAVEGVARAMHADPSKPSLLAPLVKSAVLGSIR
jgi:hypothetical protein